MISAILGILEIPEWKEVWDILLVLVVGAGVFYLQRTTDLFAEADGMARGLWSACLVYALTQFLTNHAEAQGIMLSVIWVTAWQALTKKMWGLVALLVLAKIVILFLLFR